MPLKYINRKDDAYFLQSGKTRTGKPRYWFGRKMTGEPVAAIPSGFEVRESPENAIVTLRKILRSEITLPEVDLLASAVRTEAGLHYFIVDQDKDSLVVYLPCTDERGTEGIIEKLAGPFLGSRAAELKASLMARANYDKMMKFDLVDVNERLFIVKRWCFRGRIDDWIRLGASAPLLSLVKTYVKHLGKESFFDLI